MKNFKDRIATPSNQYRLTPTDKDGIYIIEFSPDEVVDEGTPINRTNMLAVQGFYAQITKFNDDDSIVETNQDGDVLRTVFNDDDTISETFTSVDGITITKRTTFRPNGDIADEIE